MGSLSTKLRTIALFTAATLFARVLLAILYEYQWYFPPDFEASIFLGGHRHSFVGVYPAAFYAHILSGPLALVLGAFQMASGGVTRHANWHRWLGRIQMVVIVVLTVSGLIMARQAFAGPVAARGFAMLAIATASTAIAAAYFAIIGQMLAHRRWACRCFLLLCSPLLLRLVAGLTIVTQFESPWTYRLNAWLSWLVPLAIHEAWCHWGKLRLESWPGLPLLPNRFVE